MQRVYRADRLGYPRGMAEPERFAERLEEGRDLFNRGCFFEAHDVWEDLWAETRGEERSFLEGLIHAAVGCYHLNLRNLRGARSQLTLSRSALEGWAPAHRGIDVAGALVVIDEFVDRLGDLDAPRLEGIENPRIDRLVE